MSVANLLPDKEAGIYCVLSAYNMRALYFSWFPVLKSSRSFILYFLTYSQIWILSFHLFPFTFILFKEETCPLTTYSCTVNIERCFSHCLQSINTGDEVVLVVKNPPSSAADRRDAGLNPGLSGSLGGGHGHPL